MIIFSEDNHKYIHKGSGNKLTGWTTLIKNYSVPFDTETQLVCSAYKIFLGDKVYNECVKGRFGRLFNLEVSEVKDFLISSFPADISSIVDELRYEWDYSAINGSKFHKEQENAAFSNGYEINPFTNEKFETIFIEKEYDNQSLSEDLFELSDGYYPELLVWDSTMPQSNTVVTQIDKCFIKTENGKRLCWVDDIKTNKKRPFEGKDKFMSEPLSSMYDNSAEKYKLQVCFGAKLLNTFGFEPAGAMFTHYLNYNINKPKQYVAKYDHELMENFQKSWKLLYN